jgi:multiple sugar transport system permease protein
MRVTTPGPNRRSFSKPKACPSAGQATFLSLFRRKSPMQIARINRLTPYFFLAPAIIVMAVALFYPIGYMVWASFLDWNPSQRIGEADFIGLRNYAKLLNDAAFLESFWVTVKFAAVVVVLEMILGVGLAMLLDRQLRGMTLLRTIFILPMMIAPIVVGLRWRYMYHPSVGLLNRTPFIFILSLATLQSLPRSAMEAARIDGASGWQMIWFIKLRLMLPVLIVTSLMRLIDAFKVLEVILLMTNGGPGLSTEILALRISRTASEFRELGTAAAISNLLLIMLMALTLAMFTYTKISEARAARLRAAAS